MFFLYYSLFLYNMKHTHGGALLSDSQKNSNVLLHPHTLQNKVSVNARFLL
jgi:hypothetical protein